MTIKLSSNIFPTPVKPYPATNRENAASQPRDWEQYAKYTFQNWSHLMAFMAEQLEIEPADTG